MILPANILRCMLPADRKKLGKAGLLPEEALARAEIKSECQLQRQVITLLRLKGIEPLVHRMDKRTGATVGWPDLTFAIGGWSTGLGFIGCIAYAWECKYGKGELSVEQQQMHVRLSTPPNCFRIKVIRSVQEAVEELRSIGL